MAPGISSRSVRLKRVYTPPARSDGFRILVDRLWPRGLRKADAHVDHWVRDLAPSAQLRDWFGHRPDRWKIFKSRYAGELRSQQDGLRELRRLARKQPVTLLFSAHDEQHNNAVALRQFLIRGIPAH